MLNFLAFLFALTLLVSVHEWGHYRVAVACGVKVLRFSIGLGRPIWRWKKPNQRHGQDTELTLGCLPLGGYVLMLDDSQGVVPADSAHQAFNRQPLWARALIVAAGPVANLLFAVFLFASAAWWGQDEPLAVLSTPVAGSAAALAGLNGGERVIAAGRMARDAGGDTPEAVVLEPVISYLDLPHLATQALGSEQDWLLEVQDEEASPARLRRVRLQWRDLPPKLPGVDHPSWDVWGLTGPRAEAKVTQVMPGSPAALAGFQAGDVVLQVNGRAVPDAHFVRQSIRQSVQTGRDATLDVVVWRDPLRVLLKVTPEVVTQGGQTIGRIGIAVGGPPLTQWIAHDALESLFLGIQKTQGLMALTLRSVGEMVTGRSGLDQLGGPLSIADQAGRSAQVGVAAFLGFLGFLSISLGVLNLLPLPMLDGGHLMYYLWELLTGKPVSSDWMLVLQKVGLMLLVLLMVTSLVNDGIRLWR